MSLISAFFEKISTHFNKNLPFVAYRHPNSKTVKAQLQNTATLEFLDNFEQEGFVFAPFDSAKNSIFFSKASAEALHLSEEIMVEKSSAKTDYQPSIQEKEQHEKLVQKAVDKIASSNLEKVIVSHNPKLFTPTEPITFFKNLLATYDTAFVYIWFHPKVGLWLGATPETLLQTENKQFKTMALAGTKLSKAEDVKWEQKEIDEQAFVTRSILEDLENTAGVQSINTSKTYTHQAGKVSHLRTDISGTFSKENLGEIVLTLHPTPAVCGLPKKEAKDFILKEEHYNREFYTGYLGELNTKVQKTRNKRRRNVENSAYNLVKRQSSIYVNLRCMQVLEKKIILYVGGGITKDSNATAEWEETLNKAKTMQQIL